MRKITVIFLLAVLALLFRRGFVLFGGTHYFRRVPVQGPRQDDRAAQQRSDPGPRRLVHHDTSRGETILANSLPGIDSGYNSDARLLHRLFT